MFVAILCGACGSSGSTKCLLPAPGTPQGTLSVRESHEFGHNYEVLSAAYLVDDCVFHQTNDMAFLRKPIAEFASKSVAAGKREFRYAIKFRSGFSADMHRYEWMMTSRVPLEIVEFGQHVLTLRMFERENADPRGRMTILIETEGPRPPE